MIDTGKPSILVVVSHDFGEFAYAYDFTRSLTAVYDVFFVLPERVFQSNANLTSCNCVPYESGEDVIKTYSHIKPDCVLLFSAFLLVPDKIFSIRLLKKLISIIIRDKKLVISSDPYLGLMDSIKMKDINLDLFNSSGNVISHYAMKFLTWNKYRKIHSILLDVPCIVPFGVDHLDGNKYFSYHNNDISESITELEETPYWLFVISEIDYLLQKKYRGEERFIDCILERLVESQAFNVKPVLLAPMVLIEKLQKVMPSIKYIHRCNVIMHKSLIINAERVFYWNMISHSIYHRITNYKPLHFFGRGHLFEIIPQVHQLAMKCYYQGNEPVMINFSRPLNIEELTEQNKQFYASRLSELEKIKNYPGSLKLLEKLKAS